ncbi:MAG: S-adenosylmethionine:tRNA ribosyltransferase-isomerase [Pseudonocardiales bacterium]|nr:S-adenosylmethionine:tRNA ribosyltransferase-isomerase [Pseudonocardiales bacterium]
MTALRFELPPELEASAPPASRDAVRLLVAEPSGVRHARFADFAEYLQPGDVLVVNTSGTLAAAVEGRRGDGRAVTVHFSTALDDQVWLVEVRPRVRAGGPVSDARADETIELPAGVQLRLIAPYPAGSPAPRLWFAKAAVEGGVRDYLSRLGRPICYAYVPQPHSIDDYQTVFARDPGSAEMPSAGRPFTPRIVTDLVVRGVAIAPVTLHTGVSSQEGGEPPLAEPFHVPPATARLVNVTRAAGGRVVAVGTTVARALESAATDRGAVRPRSGWTDLLLGPERPARVVTGLVTGWHAPGASHLRLLEAVGGAELVAKAYAAALEERYLWHEFGDSCLLLP